jgi:large subunit ribosomal protein L10
MAITRERKEDLVAHYTDVLQDADGFIVTEYRGLQIGAFNAIRSVLREQDATYMVAKNRLLKIALNNVGLPVPDRLLTGPVAVAVSHGNLPGMVKVLLDKKKEMELLILKGGVVGQQVLAEGDLKMISELPSQDQIRAQLLGLLVQPAQSLLAVLNAPPQQLVGVLDAGANALANVLAAYAAKAENAA